MTRNQQIQNAAKSYIDCKNIKSPTVKTMVKIVFEQGAKWADENPIENTNKRIRRTYRNGRRKYDTDI